MGNTTITNEPNDWYQTGFKNVNIVAEKQDQASNNTSGRHRRRQRSDPISDFSPASTEWNKKERRSMNEERLYMIKNGTGMEKRTQAIWVEKSIFRSPSARGCWVAEQEIDPTTRSAQTRRQTTSRWGCRKEGTVREGGGLAVDGRKRKRRTMENGSQGRRRSRTFHQVFSYNCCQEMVTGFSFMIQRSPFRILQYSNRSWCYTLLNWWSNTILVYP